MLNDQKREEEYWNEKEKGVRKIILNILKDFAKALEKDSGANLQPVRIVEPKKDKEQERFEKLWIEYKESCKRFKGMKDLIKVDSLFSFIITACQFENVLALYRAVAAELLKDSSYEASNEFCNMLSVLTKLFDINSETRKEFVYARYDCDVQKKYDLDRATKMPCDPEAGKVLKNVLWGIRNKNTNKIESKCIVRVG